MQKVTENYLSKVTRYFYFVTEQHCTLVIFVRNRMTESDENYATKLPVNMRTVPNFLDFTTNAILRPTFIRKLL